MTVSGNAPFWVFTKKFWSFARLKVTASVIAAPLAGTIVLSTATGSLADEGGVSFWVPGFFGSLAATPQVPGFSLANVFYVNAGVCRRQRGVCEDKCPWATST